MFRFRTMTDQWKFVCPCKECECFPDRKLLNSTIQHHLRKEKTCMKYVFKCPCCKCNGLQPGVHIGQIDHHSRGVWNLDSDEDKDDAQEDLDGNAEMAGMYDDDEAPSDSSSDSGNDAEEDVQDWADPDLDVVNNVLKMFAKQMLEGIGHARLTQEGTNFVLTVLHDTLLTLSTPALRLAVPRDYRALETIAEMEEPGHWYENFCPGTKKDRDHHMFDSGNPDDERCPICKKNTRYTLGKFKRPARMALYYKFDWWTRFMYGLPEMHAHLRGWHRKVSKTRGVYADCYDGEIMAGTGRVKLFAGVDENDDLIPLVPCFDATVVQVHSANSLTPMVSDCLAFPPKIRKCFTAKYFGGCLGKGMKATNITLLPWLKHLANFKPGTAGIDMGTFKVFVQIAWLINDLRGCAGPFNAKEVGALYGACSQCNVCGSSAVKRMLGAVYYLCACRLAGGTHLEKFKETYKEVPALAEMADQPAPTARTHRAMQKSAKRAVLILSRPKVHGEGKQNESDLQKQIMKGPNHFTELFGTDCSIQNIIDPGHQSSTTVKDWLCLVMNTKGTCYIGAKRKRFTNLLGQTIVGSRPGWQASPAIVVWVDDVAVPQAKVRLPSAWAGLTDLRKLSTSQRMLLAGDLGKYFLQFYDIQDSYKKMFAELLTCLEGLQAQKHTTASLDQLENRMVQVLAECEHTLPVVWCSGVKHYNLHLVSYIRRCGPFEEHNMLAFERWHTIFKRLARGRRNIMASIHHHWTMVLASSAWRLESQGGTEWTSRGFGSSLAGKTEMDYTRRIVTVKGGRRQVELSIEDFAQVQDLWAVVNKDYDSLRDLYRTSIGERRGYGVSQLPAGQDILSLNGKQLTRKQRSMLKMSKTAYEVDRASLNNIPFCTAAHARGLQTDDSVIKDMYEELEEKMEQKPSFAWIKRLLIHELYPG